MIFINYTYDRATVDIKLRSRHRRNGKSVAVTTRVASVDVGPRSSVRMWDGDLYVVAAGESLMIQSRVPVSVSLSDGTQRGRGNDG